MKRAVGIIIIILLVLVVIGFVFWITGRKTPSTTQQPVQFPSSSATSTAIATAQNSLLTRPEVHPDQNNPGYYFIGYQPSDASAPYLIRYIAETYYFNIGILQEPIGENRKKAEQYLMQQLGATKEQMCALRYAVYIPNDVNSQYSGVNLGFSFCPGAVLLP